MSNDTEKLVFRQVAFPISAFDWLKQCQRNFEARQGHRISNNEMLTVILGEHKRLTVESGEHKHVFTDGKTRT